MDNLLTLLGVLAFGVIIVVVHFFSVRTGSYEAGAVVDVVEAENGDDRLRERATVERRSHRRVDFPLLLDGLLIREDRRNSPERRLEVV